MQMMQVMSYCIIWFTTCIHGQKSHHFLDRDLRLCNPNSAMHQNDCAQGQQHLLWSSWACSIGWAWTPVPHDSNRFKMGGKDLAVPCFASFRLAVKRKDTEHRVASDPVHLFDLHNLPSLLYCSDSGWQGFGLRKFNLFLDNCDLALDNNLALTKGVSGQVSFAIEAAMCWFD